MLYRCLELDCHSPPAWFFLPLFIEMTTAAGVSLINLCHRLVGKFCIHFKKKIFIVLLLLWLLLDRRSIFNLRLKKEGEEDRRRRRKKLQPHKKEGVLKGCNHCCFGKDSYQTKASCRCKAIKIILATSKVLPNPWQVTEGIICQIETAWPFQKLCYLWLHLFVESRLFSPEAKPRRFTWSYRVIIFLWWCI